MDEIAEFEVKCLQAWGKSERDINQLLDLNFPNIRDILNSQFCDLSPALKIHIAEKIIKESTSGGSVIDSGDGIWYLRNFGNEIEWRRGIFDFNRLRPIQAAILLFSFSFIPVGIEPEFEKRKELDHIISGGAPLATSYLVSQLEYIFRKKSRYLDEEGHILREIPDQLLQKIGLNKTPRRINQINQEFLLFLYRNNDTIARKLKKLERKIKISERLKHRHLILHGTYPDISSLGFLFSLVIAMFYYNEPKTD
ncbi:MAG TPA: hypothetical protein VMW40_08260 [Candidatus Bathyarchaeia archaeon]|nr:hypothetical protein [Candidatus Bathyarchaeia archaeon]